MESGVVDVFF